LEIEYSMMKACFQNRPIGFFSLAPGFSPVTGVGGTILAASAAFRGAGKAVETAGAPVLIHHRAEAPVLMKPTPSRPIPFGNTP
jgi:hypothetical protein